MNNIEEQFKKDFEESKKVELSFDTTQLEPNYRPIKQPFKPWKVITLSVVSTFAALFVIIAVTVGANLIKTDESVKLSKKSYAMNEIRIAESNSFKKLNNVTYPNGDMPIRNAISEEENSAYNHFADTTYHSLVNTSKNDNMTYSVVGLYSLVNELNSATSRDDLKTRLNDLLGLNEESRVEFYDKVMKANSYAAENMTTQLKNGAFFSNGLEYSSNYVEKLTRLYCEAYQIDFTNDSDVSKMVKWVNEAVKSNGFIDKEFLEMDRETVLYLFSTLYFKNAWSNKYLSDENIKDTFHLADGSEITTTYMKHSYTTEYYYDYDSYISVKDYYDSSFASITYIVPKKVDANIFELTKTANIFEEKEENKVLPEKYGIMVNLQTPKFKSKGDVNFENCFKNLGFGDMFDRAIDSFHNAFVGEVADTMNFYLQKIKQRNEVEFNEDGSIVKSVAMAAIGGDTAAVPTERDTLDVKLDQPFIYIIRDINNVPIFVGHMDNPKA